MYHYDRLPEGLRGSMQRYIEDGIQPGHFLTAVLENDLFAAVSRADGTNSKLLPEIVRWIYNEAPMSCWGSEAKVIAWANAVRSNLGTLPDGVLNS